MPTLSTAARNAASDGVVDRMDAGAAAGKLKIRASTTVLCTITLKDPAFENAGTGAAGQARAVGGDNTNPVSSGNPLTGTGSAAGTADNYQLTDSDDNVHLSGTAGATGSGAECILDNAVIASGQAVNVTALSYTTPAS